MISNTAHLKVNKFLTSDNNLLHRPHLLMKTDSFVVKCIENSHSSPEVNIQQLHTWITRAIGWPFDGHIDVIV